MNVSQGVTLFGEKVYVYTSSPNELYFWRSTPQNKACSNQSKGHFGF